LAALLGAVVSSLAAMLNAGSTILAMDIFKKHLAPKASQGTVVLIGRISVVVLAIVAMSVAPKLGDQSCVTAYLQLFRKARDSSRPVFLRRLSSDWLFAKLRST